MNHVDVLVGSLSKNDFISQSLCSWPLAPIGFCWSSLPLVVVGRWSQHYTPSTSIPCSKALCMCNCNNHGEPTQLHWEKHDLSLVWSCSAH